jgi:serine/threonine-protein kinase RsbW
MSSRMERVPRNAPISLAIPAAMEHVRLVRLVASGVGAEMGFDVESIDDLRLAVNEACGILLECSSAADGTDSLVVEFFGDTTTLQVRAQRPSAQFDGDASEVSVAVLDATSRSWRLEPHHSVVELSFSHRADS